MRRTALKAIVSLSALHAASRRRLDRERIVLLASMAVTGGLIALYACMKVRW